MVFDILKAGKEAFFTACNLWHTRKIVDQGDHWYDTVYDAIGKAEVSGASHLLIHFPLTHHRSDGVEAQRRHYQDERTIYQVGAQHFELGQQIAFVTVLVPHPVESDPKDWVDRIRYVEPLPEGKGLLMQVQTGERLISVGVKRDLRMDMVRDWRRPRYTWEAGRIRYGKMETNGDFFFSVRSQNTISYTAVNMTRAVYDGKRTLFDQRPALFGLAFDGSPDRAGVGKVRYWRDTVPVDQ